MTRALVHHTTQTQTTKLFGETYEIGICAYSSPTVENHGSLEQATFQSYWLDSSSSVFWLYYYRQLPVVLLFTQAIDVAAQFTR